MKANCTTPMVRSDSCNPTLCAVISGSFRKHLSQIVQLKQVLEQNSVFVLSPAGSAAINPKEEFIVLDSDPINNPRLLQDSVFAKIRRSTFLIVANFEGYLGRAAVLEIGFAIANGIAIYSVVPIDDPNIAPYCQLLSDAFPNLSAPTATHSPPLTNKTIPARERSPDALTQPSGIASGRSC